MKKTSPVVIDVMWKNGKTDKQISQKWNDLTGRGIRAITGKFKHSGNNTGKTAGLGAWKLKALLSWLKDNGAPKTIVNDYRAYYKVIVSANDYK